MSGIDEMPGEETTATAEFEDDPTPGAHRLEQRNYPWAAQVCMEVEPTVVDEGKISPVIGLPGRLHPDMMADGRGCRTLGLFGPLPAS